MPTDIHINRCICMGVAIDAMSRGMCVATCVDICVDVCATFFLTCIGMCAEVCALACICRHRGKHASKFQDFTAMETEDMSFHLVAGTMAHRSP